MTIAALAAVFDGVGLVPRGGVGTALLGHYLSLPAVPAVSGSWLAPRRELDAGDLSAVTERSRSARAAPGAGSRHQMSIPTWCPPCYSSM